jgi:streptogrisin C
MNTSTGNRAGRRLSAVALVVGVAVALTTTASGAAASEDSSAVSTADAGPAPDVAPEMLDAMARDLDLTVEEATERLAREQAAAHTALDLREQLGDAYGGSWLDDQQNLIVAVAGKAPAGLVHDAGATATVVDRSFAELKAELTQLDRAGTPDPDQVTGWHIDVVENTVTVQVTPGAAAAGAAFIRDGGLDPATVRITVVDERPEVANDIRGGDRYNMPGTWCSVGFSVVGGFITAGHCGGVGTPTTGFNGVAQGTVAGASFPGNDHGWVSINSNWNTTPLVNRYSGGQTVTVNGSTEAPVNASICRSGTTTGWQCGTITGKNHTVNYPQGSVFGLTRTTACAEPGDSGGSFISGDQAQGVTSGGIIGCPGNGPIYFAPIWPILSTYNLSLVTGSGGTPPQITNLHCESGGNQFFCMVSYNSSGSTTVTWTQNGFPIGTGDSVFSSCFPGDTITVEVSNAHGSDNAFWFGCSSGPWP